MARLATSQPGFVDMVVDPMFRMAKLPSLRAFEVQLGANHETNKMAEVLLQAETIKLVLNSYKIIKSFKLPYIYIYI